MRFRTMLNNLGSEIMYDYPNINEGGCCVFASMVAYEMKRLNIPAKGIVASWDAEFTSTDIDTVRNNVKSNTLKEWQTNGISFTHVGIEFRVGEDRYFYDANGVIEPTRYLGEWRIYQGRMEYEELKALASRARGWNNNFNRKDIPEIRKIVKSHFKSFKESSKKSAKKPILGV